jgi:hypothetical protein
MQFLKESNYINCFNLAKSQTIRTRIFEKDGGTFQFIFIAFESETNKTNSDKMLETGKFDFAPEYNFKIPNVLGSNWEPF